MLFIYFVTITFSKIILLLLLFFFHENYFYFFMFRNVPCSRFYRRPGMMHTVLLHCRISAEIRTVLIVN